MRTHPAAPCTISYVVATVPGTIGVPWGKETFDDTVVDLRQVGLSIRIPEIPEVLGSIQVELCFIDEA